MDHDLPPKPGYRNLRKGRASIPGQAYLVTAVCHHRDRRFSHWPMAAPTCAALAEARLWRDSQLLCWVLMPDHLHAMLTLGSSESLSHLLQRVKAVTAQVANAACGHTGPVWMSGYHERALRRDDDIRASARYLAANPLRAGLVKRAGDYPYWDAIWLEHT